MSGVETAPARPLSRVEAQLLDIGMLVALGGVETTDLTALGDEAGTLAAQIPLGSPVARIAFRLETLPGHRRGGEAIWLEDYWLRRACAEFFRARYVRNRRPGGG